MHIGGELISLRNSIHFIHIEPFTMNWRDLLYFSKGERRALTLLLCLITVSWILLLWTERKRMPIDPRTDAHRTEIRQASGERRIITGKDTSEKETNPIRQKTVSRPVPAALANDIPSPAGKKRKGYPLYTRPEKYTAGTLIELNTADTAILKKVPGIGSTFARRIVKYRELLGGFYDISQLAEVYGIDEDRYQALAPWFITDTLHIRKLEINVSPAATLRKHPYLSYRQAKAIEQLRKQKSRLSGWENLELIEEFTDTDKKRLIPYLSFK